MVGPVWQTGLRLSKAYENRLFIPTILINIISRFIKKIPFIGLLLLVIVIDSNAQRSDPSQYRMNGVYSEFYVLRPDFSDGFISVNYERGFGKKNRFNCRIGIWPDFESSISIPLTVNWITGPNKRHHFEYGIGAVLRIEHYVYPYDPAPLKTWFYDIPAIMVPLMYRYQKNSGLFFRGGINIFLSWPTLPSPTLSIGYRF